MSPLPYPSPIMKEKDIPLANELTALFAGKGGEFSAIARYSYQHIVLSQSSPVVADTLECIGVVEMRHFELLGKMIHSLGVLPKLCENVKRRQYCWSGSFIMYAERPEKIIAHDIYEEKRGVLQYKAFMKKCGNDAVNDVIKRILLDEERHIEMLERLL